MTTEAKTKAYRVTAPLVTVRTGRLAGIIPGRTGYTVVSLYRGAAVPADAPADDVQRLLTKGAIEAVPDA